MDALVQIWSVLLCERSIITAVTRENRESPGLRYSNSLGDSPGRESQLVWHQWFERMRI